MDSLRCAGFSQDCRQKTLLVTPTQARRDRCSSQLAEHTRELDGPPPQDHGIMVTPTIWAAKAAKILD